MVVWGDTLLTGRVVEVQGDYVLVEVIPDLRIDLDAWIRKLFVPGRVLRIHRSSLREQETIA